MCFIALLVGVYGKIQLSRRLPRGRDKEKVFGALLKDFLKFYLALGSDINAQEIAIGLRWILISFCSCGSVHVTRAALSTAEGVRILFDEGKLVFRHNFAIKEEVLLEGESRGLTQQVVLSIAA